MVIILEIIGALFLFAVPVFSLRAFICSLAQFIKRDRSSEKECAERRFALILSSVPAVLFAAFAAVSAILAVSAA